MRNTESSNGGGKSARQSQNEEKDNKEMDNTLHEAFLDELADAYNFEKQLTKALPKLAKASQSEELRSAFEAHLEETENHANRVEQAAKSVGATLKRKKCAGMEGIIEEGGEMMKEFKGSDAVLIAAAQKAEHYEIATYGTLCAWAEKMGHDEAASLLKENLDEEKAADEKLTGIAESAANSNAQSN